MRQLIEMEDSDVIRQDGLRIKSFHKEINNTFDKNLDNCLEVSFDKIVDEYNLVGSESESLMRKLIQEIKRTLYIK